MSKTIAVPTDFCGVANVFNVLRIPLRVQILFLIAPGEKSVDEICKACDASREVVAHHLQPLRVAGVIEPCRDGKRVIYSLTESGREVVLAASNLGKHS